jgi:glycosyltransferase involved in cell wall biosynthesis
VSIAVLITSLPERRHLLTEAIESVADQTLAADDVVIGVDPYRLGEVANMNRLIGATDCDWLAFLHDDDLWLPNHLSVAAGHFDTADVIVSRVTTVGRPQHTLEPQHADFNDLRVTNWFPPSAVVVRREVFGEWCEPYGKFRWVDWANWNRLLEAGARMVHTNEATLLYRFGDWGNGSWH